MIRQCKYFAIEKVDLLVEKRKGKKISRVYLSRSPTSKDPIARFHGNVYLPAVRDTTQNRMQTTHVVQ